MDYESLSSVVLAVMAAVLILGWLPKRTTRGMKRASEHREDRYSSSLHIVDARHATRFSDEDSQQTKGLSMESQQQRHDSAFSQERVARIRTMRRQAVRRRQILVAALVAVTVVVVVLAFSMQFSPFFALIPALATVTVLVLGAKASGDARRWEQELSEANRNKVVRKAARTHEVERRSHADGSKQDPRAQTPKDPEPVYMTVDGALGATVNDARLEDDSSTAVIAAGDVHDILRQAEQDKRQALALRQKRAERKEAMLRQEDESLGVESLGAEAVRDDADRSDAAADADEEHEDKALSERSRGQKVQQTSQSAVRTADDEIPDATNELSRISPSPALDAFEMAAAQDLISFSLGEARGKESVPAEEVESLEIKSVRQVATAVPKESVSAPEHGSRESASGKDSQSASAKRDADDEVPKDASRFHEAESHADVAAPEQTSDSLGVNLESILARRSKS
ncbi:MAG: Membrane spanning protein [Bifidobacterium crudilactis]|jgi:hypothetical protein|uniref:hypothetical protein n=1 Tax=Bifidobacterium crudilactis TaxID=327277 RepID=UPI003A5BEC42